MYVALKNVSQSVNSVSKISVAFAFPVSNTTPIFVKYINYLPSKIIYAHSALFLTVKL